MYSRRYEPGQPLKNATRNIGLQREISVFENKTKRSRAFDSSRHLPRYVLKSVNAIFPNCMQTTSTKKYIRYWKSSTTNDDTV